MTQAFKKMLVSRKLLKKLRALSQKALATSTTGT
jgi:hypothetical protein